MSPQQPGKSAGGQDRSIVDAARTSMGNAMSAALNALRKPLGAIQGKRPGDAAESPAEPPASGAAPNARADLVRRHRGSGFLAPTDLAVTATKLDRVALIGSCMLQAWELETCNPTSAKVDLILVNNMAALPALTEAEIRAYDFQVIQVPLRSVLHDDQLWHVPQDDLQKHEAEFKHACWTLENLLEIWMKWNAQHGLLTFVANFFVPQQNPLGRLFPRFDLRNPEYFVTRLNEHLERYVRSHRNAYVLDVDRLSASIGRRYTQDDAINTMIHSGLLPREPELTHRMEQVGPVTEYYDIRWREELRDMVWSELLAMYRTIRQVDSVKLVVVDLDDTMWNGISGEMTDFDITMVDGWPFGLAESLMYLKKRGVLLAILSKNEEARIREIWPMIYGERLRLDDFAAVHINWTPKVEGMKAILEAMSLLPRSVVFIDDNPAERDAMQRAFPQMRILGREPYYLKRILQWAPETQVATITEESGKRTEMMQAQLVRESERKTMSREQFLREASPKVKLYQIDAVDHPKMARALELVNKTNQFNTTGRRWTLEGCEAWLRKGGQLVAFEVNDKFTAYGLVGVVIVELGRIEQWVMSCRVLGYQIEEAVMSVIVGRMREYGAGAITAPLVKTDANFPCRDLFGKCGFVDPAEAGQWTLAADVAVPRPGHVETSI